MTGEEEGGREKKGGGKGGKGKEGHYKKGLKDTASLRPGNSVALRLSIHLVSRHRIMLLRSPPREGGGIYSKTQNFRTSNLNL